MIALIQQQIESLPSYRLESVFKNDFFYVEIRSPLTSLTPLEHEVHRLSIQSLAGNFFFQLCTRIIGYRDDFESYFRSTLSYEEAKRYVNQHYPTSELINIDHIPLYPFTERFVHDEIHSGRKPLFPFKDSIDSIYVFEDFSFLYGDRETHYPVLFMINKQEFEKKTQISLSAKPQPI